MSNYQVEPADRLGALTKEAIKSLRRQQVEGVSRRQLLRGALMGEICLDKAVHSELVSMCEDVIATQTAEREDLLTWLSTWYGVSHEPQMTPGQERQMDKLMELSGADFEVAFMESLIRHHALAVVRAERCRDQGGHASLLAMCGDIVAAQSAEISMLQTWLCDWYDRCRGRPA